MNWDRIPYTKIIIQKQCEIAKLNFENIDFDEDDWYHDNTWTSKDEANFKEWFIDFLKTNKLAREEVMQIPGTSNKRLESLFGWWNLMYGFRIKND